METQLHDQKDGQMTLKTEGNYWKRDGCSLEVPVVSDQQNLINVEEHNVVKMCYGGVSRKAS